MTNVNCDDMRSSACAEDETNKWKTRRDYGFIVFAGALIGFGAGLLIDMAGPGFLVGLGLGFLGAGMMSLARRPREGEVLQTGSSDITTLLIGAFLVFIGLCFVYAPAAIWPYSIAAFLILLGIWFLVSGFSRARGCTRFP